MRARNIKPGFFENEHLADCDPLARILFAGLWCMADRAGRLEDRPKKIKVKILPYDECSVEDLLNQLEQYGFITRYIVNNQRYIQIDNFGRHQNPHCKEAESTIPAPCQHSASTVQTQEEPRKGFPELKEGDGERQDHPGSTQEASVADGQSKNKEQQETSGKSTFNKEHSASTVQAPEEHRSSPADSLIPDSGFSDSLIPDSKRERGTHVPPVDEYVAEIKTTDENKPLNIKQAQSERWQQKFRFIDVEAELYRLSQWAEQNPGKRWTPKQAFFACSGALGRKNQQALLDQHSRDPTFDPSDPDGNKGAEARKKRTLELVNKMANADPYG